MADLDTSELLIDPDFCDIVQLIRRSSTVNDKGRNVLVEAEPVDVFMSVQGPKAEDFKRYPDLVNLDGAKAVWYSGILLPLVEGEYSDIIVWNGLRYQVHKIDEDYSNFGGGYMKAFCALQGNQDA